MKAPLLHDVGGVTDREHGGEMNASNVEINAPRDGLSDAEAVRLFQQYGPNELPEKKKSTLMRFLGYFWGPIPWLMEIATVISFVLFVYNATRGDFSDPATWVVLLILLLVNGLMGFVEESKAGNAIEALKKSLAPMARVKRNGAWIELPSRELVPGDLVILKLGDIVPADSKLLEGEPMEVDQSALTGESLPVTVYSGDVVYSGSTIKRGELHAVVYATGARANKRFVYLTPPGPRTFFGKAAALVQSVQSRGHLQMILLKIAYTLMITAIILVGILVTVQIAAFHSTNAAAVIVSALVLLVASIPIAMQVVTTCAPSPPPRAPTP